jgi:hypothetical protein
VVVDQEGVLVHVPLVRQRAVVAIMEEEEVHIVLLMAAVAPEEHWYTIITIQ